MLGRMTDTSPTLACERCGQRLHACRCTDPYLVPDPDQFAGDTLLGVPEGEDGVRLPEN